MVIIPVPGRDHARHELRSTYVERCWLPVIGPTCVAFLRLCPDLWVLQAPYEAPDLDIAHMLGQGQGAKARDVAKRLHRFRLADWDPTTQTVRVRCLVPPLNAAQLERCPAPVRAIHNHLNLVTHLTQGDLAS